MSHPNPSGWIAGMRRFAFARPVLFSILVILATGLLTEIPFDALFLPLVGDPAAEFLRVIIGHTLTGLLLVGLLVKLDLFKRAGFTPPRQWKALWLTWPLALFTLLNLEALIDGSLVIDTSRPGLIALYTLLNLSIGFCEEVMGRGMVLMVMLQRWGATRRGVYRAVLMSGALFGAGHLFNLITGHLPPLAALTQIGYSFAFGVVLAACFLRNNAIWPVMAWHAALDFAGGLRHIAVDPALAPVANNTVGQAIGSLIVSLPLVVYGLLILRKVPPRPERDLAGDQPNQRKSVSMP